MKTKWMVLLLVLGLLFFGLGCLADSVAVEGIGAVVFFPGLIGLLERIWPEGEGAEVVIEPGSPLPIHRHPTKDESFVILRGKVRVTTHNDDGFVIEDVVLSQESGNYGVDIPKNVWQKLESLELGGSLSVRGRLGSMKRKGYWK